MNGPMSFTRFIELPENRSALLAIRHLVQTALPGESVAAASDSPLYLHGPPGSGKSSLVASAAREFADASISSLVISAAHLDSDASDLHHTPLLAIEDLQHLPLFRAERLAQLLDQRQARGKITILTARVGPYDLSRKGEVLPPRLLSRLAQGLVVALSTWSVPSRLQFLQELGRRQQLVVPAEIWGWLAQNLGGTGRQLESAVRQLRSLNAAHPYNLSFDMVTRHFQEQAAAQRPSVDRIVHKVSGLFGVKARHLQSGKRARQVLLPRQVSMYLARRLTRLSLEQIGAYFGGRDHSTVLHACRKIEQAMVDDAHLSYAVRQLQAELT